MKNDSNDTNRELKASAATMPGVEPEDLSRFEGEGGRQNPGPSGADEKPRSETWKEIVARYQKPSVRRGVWQIVNRLVPYAALWYLMYLSLVVSYWLAVGLAQLLLGPPLLPLVAPLSPFHLFFFFGCVWAGTNVEEPAFDN